MNINRAADGFKVLNECESHQCQKIFPLAFRMKTSLNRTHKGWFFNYASSILKLVVRCQQIAAQMRGCVCGHVLKAQEPESPEFKSQLCHDHAVIFEQDL